jgi:hypothetical protein
MATTNTETDTVPTQSTAERAKEEAARVGDTAKEQGRALVADASDRLKGEAQHQSERAAQSLRSISTDFRSMAQSTDDPGPAADWVRIGADRIDSIADRLEGGGFDGLMNDVGRFARRNPSLFLLTTFGVGLLAGRVLKNLDLDSVRDTGGQGESTTQSSQSGSASQRPGGVSSGSSERVNPNPGHGS